MTGRGQIEQLFERFQDEAFRLEVLTAYNVGAESESVARFAAGAYLPEEPFPGVSFVREVVSRGRRTSLVRLVSMPPRVAERYSLDWVYPHHAAAGREIHILARGTELAAEALAAGDYWMFDSTTVVMMRYDQTGDIRCRDVVTDPAEVAYRVDLRDRLLTSAESFTQWLAGWRQRTL